MTTLDERIETARKLYPQLGGGYREVFLHRLALDLAAERERLVAVLRRIGGKGNQVYCRDGHEECSLLARAALAPEPRA